MDWKPKFISEEAKESSYEEYKFLKEKIYEDKKLQEKYLYEFYLKKGEEKRIRLLLPLSETLMVFEHKFESKDSRRWISYTCRSKEDLGECAFDEFDKPKRSFKLIIYDYDHIDKDTSFRKVKVFPVGIHLWEDLRKRNEKYNLLKRDIILSRGETTYTIMQEDESPFLKDNPEELKKVKDILKEQIWIKQYQPKTLEEQKDDIKYKLIIRSSSKNIKRPDLEDFESLSLSEVPF